MEAPWRSMTNDSSWKVMEHETKTHTPSNHEFFLLGYSLCPMHFMRTMKSFSWKLQQLTNACDFQWCPFTWHAQPMSIMFDFGSPNFIASWAFVFGLFFCLLAMSPILFTSLSICATLFHYSLGIYYITHVLGNNVLPCSLPCSLCQKCNMFGFGGFKVVGQLTWCLNIAYSLSSLSSFDMVVKGFFTKKNGWQNMQEISKINISLCEQTMCDQTMKLKYFNQIVG